MLPHSRMGSIVQSSSHRLISRTQVVIATERSGESSWMWLIGTRSSSFARLLLPRPTSFTLFSNKGEVSGNRGKEGEGRGNFEQIINRDYIWPAHSRLPLYEYCALRMSLLFLKKTFRVSWCREGHWAPPTNCNSCRRRTQTSAAHCSVLLCSCSVVQFGAVCCGVCYVGWLRLIRCLFAVCCSVCCSISQCVAACVAVCCIESWQHHLFVCLPWLCPFVLFLCLLLVSKRLLPPRFSYWILQNIL